MINSDNELITQLNYFEDNGSGLMAIPMTDEDWVELCLEKPHYSDDKNIQKKFEYAVKHTEMGRVFSALCKELDVLELSCSLRNISRTNNCGMDTLNINVIRIKL